MTLLEPPAARVLIVDDDPHSIQIIRQALGSTVTLSFALSGAEALDLLNSGEQPDLILLDVMMPGMDGYEVCRRIKNAYHSRTIPIIFITASSDAESETRALEAGAVDFIPKPTNRHVVHLRVASQILLRQRELALQQLNAELELRVVDRTKALADALQRAETANRAKSTFLANMSHELRTPLNGIIGMAGIMQRKETDPDKIRRLESVLKSANDLNHVLGNVLEHARLEANLVMLESREFSVPKLAERLTSRFGPSAAAKKLEWSIDLGNLPQRLVGAFEQVAQILEQLLDNAVKFTDVGRIDLSATVIEKLGTQVRVAFHVSDSGCGVPAERQAQIFTPFEQADNSLTRGHGGTGLGLAIAQQLAGLMNGEIRLERSDANGSMFVAQLRLELPTNSTPG